MSFAEVNRLRKAGHLSEALAMAEADLKRVCGSWEKKALFWCLNDKIKVDDVEAAQETYSRMSVLCEECGRQDSVMQECLRKASSYLNVHSNEVKSALQKAKTEKMADVAYKEVSILYEQGALNQSLLVDYGWIIYYALKQNDDTDILYRKKLLFQYLKLNLEQPSILHSLILSESVRIENTTPLQFLFSAFLDLWNLDNLREDDWQRNATNEGKTLPSLVEKIITAYVKEMSITPEVMPTEKVLSMVDKALELFPDNQYLPRQKAKILVRKDDLQGAIRFYKKQIILSPGKSYLWKELSELVDDSDLRISLLCQSLCCGEPDEYLGKIHILFALELCNKRKYDEARGELASVEKTYNKNGWPLPREYFDVFAMIPQETISRDNKRDFYLDNRLRALEFVFSELPVESFVKISSKVVKKPSKNNAHKERKIVLWTLLSKNGERVTIKPALFGLSSKSANETRFLAWKDNGRLVYLTPVNETFDWVKQISGKIRIIQKSGKTFGFVDDCYIHAKFLGKISEGDSLTVLAIRRDGRWSAECLVEDDNKTLK